VNKEEKAQLDRLLEKYNAILLHSMSIAVAEDFINLIIVNQEDKNFELSHLLKNKTSFRKYITAQFLKINGPSISKELSEMEEIKFSIHNKKVK
jgi:hypothetical protein